MELKNILTQAVAALGFEFLGYDRQGRVLRVYVEQLSGVGITLSDCQRISRHVGAVLDVESSIRGPYALEVSSKGVDRLFIRRHYEHHIGHELKIKLYLPREEKQRHYKGQIQRVLEQGFYLQVNEATIFFNFNEVDRAYIVSH